MQTFRGHMQNGVVVLDGSANLADGTPVRIDVEQTDSRFWQNRSVTELAREQGVQPLAGPDELAGDWPPEDSLDEMLSLVREVRS